MNIEDGPSSRGMRHELRRQLGRLRHYMSRKFRALYAYLREKVLEEEVPRPRRLFPKHLVILPVEKKVELYVMDYVVEKIEEKLGDFFYDIKVFEHANPGKRFHKKGVKKVKKSKIAIYPSQSFYKIGRSHLKDSQTSNVVVLVMTKRQLHSGERVFEMSYPVFGEANRLLDICIVSLRPLKEKYWGREENRALLRERAAKEVIHELGHLIIHSLDHCDDPKCVMRYSVSIEQVDEKGLDFCPRCYQKVKEIKRLFNI
ncbi:MAG: hypothetical protein ACTSU5_10200 [Promethearchaeota archaeon]